MDENRPAGQDAGAAQDGGAAAAPARGGPALADQVGQQAERKLRARRNGPQDVWFGLGMMGLIGWSVAVPTILGAVIGIWLDKHYASSHSWTLALLVGGLVLGCLNAWRWVDRQDKAMRDEEADRDA